MLDSQQALEQWRALYRQYPTEVLKAPQGHRGLDSKTATLLRRQMGQGVSPDPVMLIEALADVLQDRLPLAAQRVVRRSLPGLVERFYSGQPLLVTTPEDAPGLAPTPGA